MKNCYRIMLGKANSFAAEAKTGNFIGGDFDIDVDIDVDLSSFLPDNYRDFNKHYIPVFLSKHPEKSKISSGLACGSLWVIAKGINKGDIILSSQDSDTFMVGEVTGDYSYNPGQNLPHRRDVNWFTQLDKSKMPKAIKHSVGSIGTVAKISKYSDELSLLIEHRSVTIYTSDESVEDPTVFALEKHLEDFLVPSC